MPDGDAGSPLLVELTAEAAALAARAGVDAPNVMLAPPWERVQDWSAFAVPGRPSAIVVHPQVALYPAAERQAVLAHEIGHVADRSTWARATAIGIAAHTGVVGVWATTVPAVPALLFLPKAMIVLAGFAAAGVVVSALAETIAERNRMRITGDMRPSPMGIRGPSLWLFRCMAGLLGVPTLGHGEQGTHILPGVEPNAFRERSFVVLSDDAWTRHFLGRAFEVGGGEVRRAALEDAGSILAVSPPDVVVIDDRGRDRPGREVLPRVLAEGRAAVIVVSVTLGASDEDVLRRMGVDDVLGWTAIAELPLRAQCLLDRLEPAISPAAAP